MVVDNNIKAWFIGNIHILAQYTNSSNQRQSTTSLTLHQTTLVDVSRSKSELGLSYLPMSQTLREMAASLIDLGIVPKKPARQWDNAQMLLCARWWCISFSNAKSLFLRFRGLSASCTGDAHVSLNDLLDMTHWCIAHVLVHERCVLRRL